MTALPKAVPTSAEKTRILSMCNLTQRKDLLGAYLWSPQNLQVSWSVWFTQPLPDPQRLWRCAEILLGCKRNTFPCLFSRVKKASLLLSCLLKKGQISDGGNSYVGAGTDWQHRTCSTPVKSFHCLWAMQVLPKAWAFFLQVWNKAFHVPSIC